MANRIGNVAITGASGQVATLLQEKLAGPSNQVTALNQGEDRAPVDRYRA